MDDYGVNQEVSSVSQPADRKNYQCKRFKTNCATPRPKRSPARSTPTAINKLPVTVMPPERTQPTKVTNATKTEIRMSSCRSKLIGLCGILTCGHYQTSPVTAFTGTWTTWSFELRDSLQ